MWWETVNGWEVLLLLTAGIGMLVHILGLRTSLEDRRCLRRMGLNGARRMVVAGHVRGHVSRLVANGTVLSLTFLLMTRRAPAADRTAPSIMAALVVIAIALLIDSVMDALERRELAREL